MNLTRLALLILLTGPCFAPALQAAPPDSDAPRRGGAASTAADRYVTRSIQGRVVWLADALQQQYGIQPVPEAAQRILALQTPDGELIPIIEDVRGRAFRRDPRLRDMNLELLVRQYRGLPFVQVIQVFAIRPDGKYELDYWCEVCAIAMFELKPCDCCGGKIKLRQRKVSP